MSEKWTYPDSTSKIRQYTPAQLQLWRSLDSKGVCDFKFCLWIRQKTGWTQQDHSLTRDDVETSPFVK